MKSKVLPFSLLTFLVGLTVFLISFKGIDNTNKHDLKDQKISNKSSKAYYSMLRNNQETGKLNTEDVLLAKSQINSNLKSTYSVDWTAKGPDNFAGRTRSILFDNTDSEGNTLYAGSVSGGIWKTENAGLSWNKVNGETNNLNVSCMAQNSNGTIFVGTGELFYTQDYSGFGQLGYNGGFVGTGIYKSTDGESFELLPATAPASNNDDVEWAYINEIALDNGRIYAATSTGLRYSDDEGASWSTPDFAHDSVYLVTEETNTIECDSIEVSGSNITMYNPVTTATNVETITHEVDRTLFPVNGNCLDVKVSADGSVIANYNEYTLVYQSGNDFVFENKANYPDNPYYVVKLNSTITNTLIFPGGDTTYSYEVSHDYLPYEGTDEDISNQYVSRIEYAFSPSEPNIVYASAVNTNGSLINIYRSEDNANTWSVILPGNSTTEIFGEQGAYNNTLIVSPNNSGRILLGGIDMWQGLKVNEEGYFSWSQKSNGLFFPMSDLYLHSSHHDYAFRPGHPDEVYVATDGGVAKGNTSGEFTFQTLNKNYNSSQFYSVACSGEEKEVMGGSQGNGTIFISGEGNTFQTGISILNGDGGACDISLINPDIFIASMNSDFYRSEDRADNYSATSFLGDIDIPTDAFYTPAALWESFDHQNNFDTIKFIATRDYYEGNTIYASSNNSDYPIPHVLTEDLPEGDSINIIDVVQSKYFLATEDNVWLTRTVHDFSGDLEWYNIANDDETLFSGNSQCLGYSSDANHLFVGTQEGELFRMSNIALAYNYDLADCNSSECIIATSKLPIYLPGTSTEISQVITSVSVNPNDPNNVIVTLGNYGNEDYIYMTTNALDSLPDFTSIQGDPANGGLPQMPVYSSLIEMGEDNLVMIGTENGIYVSTNVFDASPSWEAANTNMGNAPVFMLKQQIVKKQDVYVPYVIGTDTSYVTHKGVNNYGVIYAATFGHGLFITDQFQQAVGIDEPENNLVSDIDFILYPNPVKDIATLKFNLKEDASVLVNVFDLNGRLINSINSQNTSIGINKINLDCSSLSKGTYLVQVVIGQSTANSKFVIL